MNEIEVAKRTATFSSSSIWKLMTNGKAAGSFGAPAFTYIAEKRMEKRLGRPLQNEANSKHLAWGNLLEKRVFDMMGMEHKLESRVRYSHPTIKEWTGMPDTVAVKGGRQKVSDIKCPFTLKSFCAMVDLLENSAGSTSDLLKEERPEYYWQLVSNAALTGAVDAELVLYVPYKREIKEIRETEDGYITLKYLMDDELPWLVEGGHYKNFNIIPFEVPKADINALEMRVIQAVSLLNK